jgi:tRNA nucleotidyltransferase (CCA-adding enzyme)
MLERWEHYENDRGGIGVRGFGGTEAEAFEQAALALTAAITDPQGVAPRERVDIRCEAPTPDQLLATWLCAVRARMMSSRMLFSRFEVWLEGTRLTAHAWGEPVNPERHELRLKLKEARPDTPRVARHAEGWMAQAIMDF